MNRSQVESHLLDNGMKQPKVLWNQEYEKYDIFSSDRMVGRYPGDMDSDKLMTYLTSLLEVENIYMSVDQVQKYLIDGGLDNAVVIWSPAQLCFKIYLLSKSGELGELLGEYDTGMKQKYLIQMLDSILEEQFPGGLVSEMDLDITALFKAEFRAAITMIEDKYEEILDCEGEGTTISDLMEEDFDITYYRKCGGTFDFLELMKDLLDCENVVNCQEMLEFVLLLGAELV